MPLIYINGQPYEATADKTVIQVAFDNGLNIPHFCWHPELSVAGNCRMCLVEIGMPRRLADGSFEKDKDGNAAISFMPKLQIACATQVMDGMHVRTNSDAAVKAQEAVMEFLLINHPLDCPICDEAGQCKLQEYAFTHSRGESRFEEMKNRKDKRQSWGPNVLFDAERCISCSRCIRFAQEIAEQDVLTFVDRADHVTIKLYEGTEFDNPYSMNVIDICPVGALTSKDFRFKSRVWDMSFNDSVCPGCAKGCNTQLGVRNNEILRIEPRTNNFVNKFWMCDYGRLTQYKSVNEHRLNEPLLRDNGITHPVSWQEAIAFAAKELNKYKPYEIMALGSAKATNEDNYLFARFASRILNTSNLDFLNHIDLSFGDNFLKKNDKCPNTAGANEVGVKPGKSAVSCNELAEKINSGQIKALYIIEDDFDEYLEIESALDKLELLIVHSSNHSKLTTKANIVFSVSSYAEIEGTYVNFDKRVQHFTPALVTSENIRTMGMKMSRLDKFGSFNDRWTRHELRKTRQSWKVIQAIANLMKAGWNFNSSKDVFDDISKQLQSFNGMTYELLDEYQGLTLGMAHKPDAKIHNYHSFTMKPE